MDYLTLLLNVSVIDRDGTKGTDAHEGAGPRILSQYKYHHRASR